MAKRLSIGDILLNTGRRQTPEGKRGRRSWAPGAALRRDPSSVEGPDVASCCLLAEKMAQQEATSGEEERWREEVDYCCVPGGGSSGRLGGL